MVDPDVDDEIYIKDINSFPTKCVIKRNQNYDPKLHPKYLLAKNQENFNIIFAMLQASNPELCEPVWGLISKLPRNESVIESLKTLEFVQSGAADGWLQLLDPQAIFKLLYCLQIISSEFMNVAVPTRDDEMYDDDAMNAEF